MFALGEEECQEEQNLRTSPVLSTTAGSPGEPEEAAGSRRGAAMREKHVANEAPEQGWPGLHVGLLLWSFPASGCTKGPSCPWLPNHTGAIGWNQIPLCLPHLRRVEVFDLRETGPSRPAGRGTRLGLRMRSAEAAAGWSLERIDRPAAGREPLSTSLLPGFGRDRRKSGGRSDLTARCAGKWPCTQWAPHVSHFSRWKWILWDCPFW